MFIKDFQHQCQDVKLILQELANANKQNTPDYKTALRIMSAYKEFNEYIIHGDCTRKESRDKFVAWVKSKYDYKISDLFPKPEKKDSVYLKDCSNEIYLLQILTRKEMNELVSDIDTERMAHLLFLLGSNDPTYARQKKELVNMLLKQDSSGSDE